MDYPLRRKDKATSYEEALEILGKAKVVRIGVCHNGPYCIPVIFCLMNGALYFHSAKEGRKVEALKDGTEVCFETDEWIELVKKGRSPCGWTITYRSVIGGGRVYLVKDLEEKKRALKCLVEKYSPGYDWEPSEEETNSVLVFKVLIEKLSGKVSK